MVSTVLVGEFDNRIANAVGRVDCPFACELIGEKYDGEHQNARRHCL